MTDERDRAQTAQELLAESERLRRKSVKYGHRAMFCAVLAMVLAVGSIILKVLGY